VRTFALAPLIVIFNLHPAAAFFGKGVIFEQVQIVERAQVLCDPSGNCCDLFGNCVANGPPGPVP
jgi:hypothetical protein